MTADIRTAAEDAMIRANAVEPLVVVKGEEAVMQLTDYGNGFIAGAAWAAARVTPTREQVAGLRAVEREAAAKALDDAAYGILVSPAEIDPGKRVAFHRGADAVYDALRARAAEIRERKS